MAKQSAFSQMRKKSSNLEKLQEKVKTKKYEKDDRYWQAELDKAGQGEALIRFLPQPNGEELPFVKYYSYGFQDPKTKRWFIENCPSTLKKASPVLEANNALWDSGDKNDEELARKRKRRLSYVSNILVVDDPANPENNGKVFLFRYGAKIFEKIQQQITPEFSSQKPCNIFDFDEGANFRLRIARKDGYANYDSATFEAPSPLADSEEEMERIWLECHSLAEIISEDKFKSYEELQKKLDYVTGANGAAVSSGQTVESKMETSADVANEPDLPEENALSGDDMDTMEDIEALLAD